MELAIAVVVVVVAVHFEQTWQLIGAEIVQEVSVVAAVEHTCSVVAAVEWWEVIC